MVKGLFDVREIGRERELGDIGRAAPFRAYTARIGSGDVVAADAAVIAGEGVAIALVQVGVVVTQVEREGLVGEAEAGIPYKSYDTWNIGVGFTYKVFTLDLRYSDTDLNKGDCNAFTSAFNATGTTNVTPINPGGAGSNWCGAAGIAKLSFDLTAMTNLK